MLATLLNDRRDSFNGFAFLHDFAITPNWAVFLQNAVAFNPLPFVLGQRGRRSASLEAWWAGHVLVGSRDSGAHAGEAPRLVRCSRRLCVPSPERLGRERGPGGGKHSLQRFSLPLAQTWTSRLWISTIPEGLLCRCSIDLASGQCSTDQAGERCCEFATVNPAQQGPQARYAWMAVAEREQGNDPLQAIQKRDAQTGATQVWSVASRSFVSEPIMVACPGGTAEDDGWVLVPVWNGAREATDLVILTRADLRSWRCWSCRWRFPMACMAAGWLGRSWFDAGRSRLKQGLALRAGQHGSLESRPM